MNAPSLDLVLALEHEAVWTYGLVGGAVPSLRSAAEAAWRAHRTERDRLLREVKEPVPPQPAYEPTTVAGEAEARERLQDLEGRIAAAWVRVVGEALTGKDRQDALSRLEAAETARLAWGGALVAFPGLDA